MAWVRIHDGAMSHPKLVGLIDWRNPFCVWVWGLSYAQQHLTDGSIPRAAIPNPTALKTAAKLVESQAWDATPSGFQIHDYLDWNDSRELVTKKRTEAKERMSNARHRSSREQRENFYVDRGVDRRISSSSERESEGKPIRAADEDPALARRAADFLEHFGELYTKHRRGARWLRRGNPNLEWLDALKLCDQWSDDRLDKMAVIFLTTDDEWISNTDRGFKVFVSKASWCDDRLAQWEAAQGRAS